MIPKTTRKFKAVALEKNLHAITPIIGTMCEDWSEELMQLCEEKHMQIQEAIQRGNLKLHKLEEIMLIDVEIRKLETQIAQACRVDRMTRQYMGNHTIALEDCCREFVALLPWP